MFPKHMWNDMLLDLSKESAHLSQKYQSQLHVCAWNNNELFERGVKWLISHPIHTSAASPLPCCTPSSFFSIAASIHIFIFLKSSCLSFIWVAYPYDKEYTPCHSFVFHRSKSSFVIPAELLHVKISAFTSVRQSQRLKLHPGAATVQTQTAFEDLESAFPLSLSLERELFIGTEQKLRLIILENGEGKQLS